MAFVTIYPLHNFLFDTTGATDINYQQLNALTNDYGSHLKILGIPCNQFELQEPGKESEILNGLKYVRPGNGFAPNFTLTSKTEVNGVGQVRIYKFLKVGIMYS